MANWLNNIKLVDGTYTTQKFHIGADKDQTITFSILGTSIGKLGISMNDSYVANSHLGSFGKGVGNASAISVANQNIAAIDSALDSISDVRASLGAVQSRFETIIASLSNVVENTDAARSRIMDADIAVETANLTKNTILQQAGVAILSQANQQPTIALALLA